MGKLDIGPSLVRRQEWHGCASLCSARRNDIGVEWDGGGDGWGHADESEMRAEESEMIGDGWGCADEAYHDTHDPVSDAEHHLDNLSMSDNHKITKYVVEFNHYVSQVCGYGEGALWHHFYNGLPEQL